MGPHRPQDAGVHLSRSSLHLGYTSHKSIVKKPPGFEPPTLLVHGRRSNHSALQIHQLWFNHYFLPSWRHIPFILLTFRNSSREESESWTGPPFAPLLIVGACDALLPPSRRGTTRTLPLAEIWCFFALLSSLPFPMSNGRQKWRLSVTDENIAVRIRHLGPWFFGYQWPEIIHEFVLWNNFGSFIL